MLRINADKTDQGILMALALVLLLTNCNSVGNSLPPPTVITSSVQVSNVTLTSGLTETPFVQSTVASPAVGSDKMQILCAVNTKKAFSFVDGEILLINGVVDHALNTLRPKGNTFATNSTRLTFAPDVFFISPDRRQALYLDWPNKIELLNAELASVAEIPWRADWGRIIGWVNNQQVLIIKNSDLGKTYNPTSVIVLDLDSKDGKEIQLGVPDLNHSNYVNWNFVNVIFSPDLSQVLYPTSSVTSGYINTIALWDFKQQTVLATLATILSETPKPSWSPDASQILVAGITGDVNNPYGKELFLINKRGEVQQLTHFFDIFGAYTRIEKFVWSPEGNKVAFWLTIGDYQTPLLFILDVNSLVLTNYCISGLPYLATSQLFWSPSDKYLAFDFQFSKEDLPEVFILDVTTGTLNQASEKSDVVGWMIAP